MHELYVKWKARTFLLIDVPPMHRSPGGKAIGIDEERYTTWNTELLLQAKSFAKATSKASIYVVSSYVIISDILDNPASYGLSDYIEEEVSDKEDWEPDVGRSEEENQKSLWEDDIHLSTAGHRIFADRLWNIFGP
ncbi:hypothetical protein D9615_007358 [Tricholomella constricta]|uniref:Uncharacterized protein n=1 Tax=Tricholomella constricta TaxID=117010 RepID=A0A8H5LXM5_9AGAR|nr:hypothetical protein D9615_007358 [Tricholomella constricta]